MKISKEFKVGLLAVVSLVLLYFGFNFLKGIDLFQRTNHYFAVYDNIDGLTISNPVVINGFSVGRVNDIKIMQNRNNLISVEISINESIRLSQGTVARLVNTDFLGSKAIELIPNEKSTVFHLYGDTLNSSIDAGITEFIKQSGGRMADNVGTTISRINSILENFQGNSEKINATLVHIESITENLSRNLPQMESKLFVLLDNLSQNSKELSTTLASLQPLLTNFTQITDTIKTLELAQTLEKTQVMIDNLNANLEQLKSGEGTMGKLMHDDSLYVNLNNTARDLDLLLVDFRKNPGRYVQFSLFGKKEKTDDWED